MVPWGTIITGVVGVVGIVGTIFAAKLNISAEDARLRRAEKRQIYARCLTTFGDLIHVMAKQYALGEDADADEALGTALVVERGEAMTAVRNAVAELLLIAPTEVMRLADSASTLLTGSDLTGDFGVDLGSFTFRVFGASDFRKTRERLLLAMRADLGERV